MKFLISTYFDLSLLDINSKKITTIENNRPHYYGITWSNNNLYLTHTNLNSTDLASDHSPIQNKGFITKNFQQEYSPTAAAHQIIYKHNKLFVANTGKNCITIFKNNSRIDFYPFQSIQWDYFEKTKIGNHLNSIWFHKENMYILAHNFMKGSFVIKTSYPELEVKKIITLNNLKWVHNIWVTDDHFLIGDGEKGAIYDYTSKKPIWTVSHPDYKYITRGFSATKQYFFVGCSPNIPNRDIRYSSNLNSIIYILDYNTFKTIDSIELQGKRCINEIRLLNELDLCHNDIVYKSNLLKTKG